MTTRVGDLSNATFFSMLSLLRGVVTRSVIRIRDIGIDEASASDTRVNPSLSQREINMKYCFRTRNIDGKGAEATMPPWASRTIREAADARSRGNPPRPALGNFQPTRRTGTFKRKHSARTRASSVHHNTSSCASAIGKSWDGPPQQVTLREERISTGGTLLRLSSALSQRLHATAR
jgi:hypothetical protein